MSEYDIAPRVAAAIENFTLPEQLGFGLLSAPDPFSWTRELV